MLAENWMEELVLKITLFDLHRVPILDQFTSDCTSHVVTSRTILEVTLDASTFFFVAPLAVQIAPPLSCLPRDRTFVLVSVPYLRRPIYTDNMGPLSLLWVNCLHHSINIWTISALDVEAGLVAVLN